MQDKAPLYFHFSDLTAYQSLSCPLALLNYLKSPKPGVLSEAAMSLIILIMLVKSFMAMRWYSWEKEK